MSDLLAALHGEALQVDCLCHTAWNGGREQNPDCPVHGTDALRVIWKRAS